MKTPLHVPDQKAMQADNTVANLCNARSNQAIMIGWQHHLVLEHGIDIVCCAAEVLKELWNSLKDLYKGFVEGR